MKSVILCEGETDAILIRYYLEKTKDWQWVKNANNVNGTRDGLFRFEIQDPSSQIANWYRNGDRHLAIWAIGGQSNFDYAIKEIMKLNQRVDKGTGFFKIALVTDRDQEESDTPILTGFQTSFSETNIQVELNSRNWSQTTYENEFAEEVDLEILPLIIPFDQEGALETFLLNAFSEDEEKAKVVQASKKFVDSIDSDVLLPNNRMRLKAEFASVFAICNPERVFTRREEILRAVRWEDYRTVREGFEKLEEV